jgi:hypothetical protein
MEKYTNCTDFILNSGLVALTDNFFCNACTNTRFLFMHCMN